MAMKWKDKKKIDFTIESSTSRYKNKKVYLLPQAVFFELPRPIEIPPSPDDNYFMVTAKYVNRLDLVANKFYVDSKLWWVLALANDLEDGQHLPLGMVIRVPSKATLYGAGGVLSDST